LPGTIRFEATQIEEIETPRPHYRVQLTSRLASHPATGSATVGLISDEIMVVVHLPTDIGTNLKVIKQAAIDHALGHIKMLLRGK
jgi:hypothetical protein